MKREAKEMGEAPLWNVFEGGKPGRHGSIRKRVSNRVNFISAPATAAASPPPGENLSAVLGTGR